MLVVCVGFPAGNVVAQLDKALGELAKKAFFSFLTAETTKQPLQACRNSEPLSGPHTTFRPKPLRFLAHFASFDMPAKRRRGERRLRGGGLKSAWAPYALRPQEQLPVAQAFARSVSFQLLVVFVVSYQPRTPGKRLRPIGPGDFAHFDLLCHVP